MPTDVSTDFNEFVNKNTKPKLDKKKIKIDVLECLSNSVEKMSIYDISKSTGYKTDNVYVAIVESKETKSKNIDNVLYWYINENQIDPPKKIIAGVEHKKVDPLFIKYMKKTKKIPLIIGESFYHLKNIKNID